MFTWLKEKLWNPIKGFFKDLFGFTELEGDCEMYRATLDFHHKIFEELNQPCDNLSESHQDPCDGIRKRDVEIARLKGENEELHSELAGLVQKYNALIDDLDETKRDKDELWASVRKMDRIAYVMSYLKQPRQETAPAYNERRNSFSL